MCVLSRTIVTASGTVSRIHVAIRENDGICKFVITMLFSIPNGLRDGVKSVEGEIECCPND